MEECREFPRKVCTQDPINVKKQIPKKICQAVPSEKCIKIPRQINKDIPRSLDKKKCFSTKPETSYSSSQSSGFEAQSYNPSPSYHPSAPVYQDTSVGTSKGYSSASSSFYSDTPGTSSYSSGTHPNYEQKRSVSAEIAPSDKILNFKWAVSHSK